MPHPSRLEVSSVSCSVRGVKILDGVTLSVAAGSIHCLIGPNGAGKTTLINVITGIMKNYEGAISLDGEPLQARNVRRLARLGVLRTFQAPQVYDELAVGENFGLAYWRAPDVSQRWRDDIIRRVRIGSDSRTKVATLSQGQKKRLELGMVLSQGPRVVLLDEPTAGMSVAETREVSDLVASLRGAVSVLVVEHDMDFVRSVADQVTVLNLGSVLLSGSVAAVQASREVRDVYLGKAVVRGNA